MEENKEMKKTSNKLLILITIAIGLILCIGSFFLGQALANKEDEILNKEEKEEAKEEEPVNKEEKEEEKNEISFDRTKCINCKFAETDIVEVRKSDEVVDFISYEFNSDDRKIVTIIADIYNDVTEEREKTNYVLTFDKKVEDVKVVGLYPDLSDSTIVFFLLEDGTVKYVKYCDMQYRHTIELNTIKDINGIVKFDILYIDHQKPTAQGMTIIAYKNDGTYYDLKTLIEATCD